MIHRLLAAAAAAAALALPVQAADTPEPAVRTPGVAERLAAARGYIQASDWSRATNELNVVIKEDPNNADAHNLLGYSWRKRATPDVTKAFSHYYTALRINPKHKGAHEYIGQAYLMDKRPLQAEQHLAELEKICGGRDCPEYQELARAIAAYKSKN